MTNGGGDDPFDSELLLRPIGVLRSPFRLHAETPRQPRTGSITDGTIVLRPGLQNAVADLSGFSHVWVIAWFNYSRGWKSKVKPPRDQVKRGVFATRAPHRPNPLALSVFELVSVRGTSLRVRGVDLLDGTPILDLKPYLPYADAIPDARTGWVAALGDSAGPDHRDTRVRPPS